MQRTAKRRGNACVPVPLSLFAQTSANFVFSTRKTAQGKCRQAGQPPLLFPARNGRGGGSPEGAEVQTCTLFSPLWALFGYFLARQKVTTSRPQTRREQQKNKFVFSITCGTKAATFAHIGKEHSDDEEVHCLPACSYPSADDAARIRIGGGRNAGVPPRDGEVYRFQAEQQERHPAVVGQNRIDERR